MNKIFAASLFAGLAAAAPALAQTTTPTTPDATTSQSAESPSGTTSTTTAPGSSEAPGNILTSPVEQDRLDPSAPSELRLQIDSGSSGAAVVDPDAPTTQPVAPGESYNSVLEGAPSNSGLSTGTSGSSGSTGVTINPTTLPIDSPSSAISGAGLPSGEIGAGISGSSSTMALPTGTMPSAEMSSTPRSVGRSSRGGGHR